MTCTENLTVHFDIGKLIFQFRLSFIEMNNCFCLVDYANSIKELSDPFRVLPTCPPCHRFASALNHANCPKLMRSVTRELRLLRDGLPSGILVCTFEDRLVRHWLW